MPVNTYMGTALLHLRAIPLLRLEVMCITASSVPLPLGRITSASISSANDFTVHQLSHWEIPAMEAQLIVSPGPREAHATSCFLLCWGTWG